MSGTGSLSRTSGVGAGDVAGTSFGVRARFGDAVCKSPLALCRALMSELSMSPDVAGRLATAYYESGEASVGVSVDSGDEIRSSRSRERTKRAVTFYREADALAARPGYCYLWLVRPSRRKQVAKEFGPNPTLRSLVEGLCADYLAVDRWYKYGLWNLGEVFHIAPVADGMLCGVVDALHTVESELPTVWREAAVYSAFVPWFNMESRLGSVVADGDTTVLRLEKEVQSMMSMASVTCVDSGWCDELLSVPAANENVMQVVFFSRPVLVTGGVESRTMLCEGRRSKVVFWQGSSSLDLPIEPGESRAYAIVTVPISRFLDLVVALYKAGLYVGARQVYGGAKHEFYMDDLYYADCHFK